MGVGFLSNQVPVEGPVLESFGEMSGLNIFLAFEVSDGTGHLQDARVGPGAQAELVNGRLQKLQRWIWATLQAHSLITSL